jgi:hypothetical protein
MPTAYIAVNQALKNGSLVVVCWEPECRQHRLPDWTEEEWIEHERVGDKHQYTHGICQRHAALYSQSIDAYFDKKTTALA